MKTSAFVVCLLVASQTQAAEIDHAVGIGFQYAGVIGYQISTQQDQHRFRGAIGLVGVSAGYDYFIAEKWSLGVTYTETIRTVYSLNINYYLDTPTQGITFGVDLGHMPDDDNGDGFFKSDGSKNVLFLSLGYSF